MSLSDFVFLQDRFLWPVQQEEPGPEVALVIWISSSLHLAPPAAPQKGACPRHTQSLLPKRCQHWQLLHRIFKQIQSTPYLNYDSGLAEEWAVIQSKCGVSAPTSVPTLATNITDPADHAAPYQPPPCLTGNTYTVVSGDNCLAIAHKLGVSSGSLITLNSLFPDCTNLLLGQVLCVPPTCRTYTIQSGDTCNSISASQSVTFQQIVGWNPTLNTYCTNLIAGQDICVSPPGGAVSLTTIPGAQPTQTGIYASTTVAPPGPAASGTTRNCGKWYIVQPGDFCQLVALNSTIDLGLFLSINPSLDAKCSSLLAGVYYCVRPTADWNSTATSTVVDPPAPTPSGTTPDCCEWYVVQSGDYCRLIETNYDITMAQLQFWNPSLAADCSNLFLGEAFCIHGAQQPDGLARPDRLPKRTPAVPTPANGWDGVRGLFANVAGRKPRAVAVPVQTHMPGGGVPRGWPGLDSPRMGMGEGAKIPTRNEL
ncbi:hypothetical protein F5B18DRAFT_676807 [Nemania serpens]|nr:hypothetical protein F5B18DRAFT_676807 [Nemania serpens]